MADTPVLQLDPARAAWREVGDEMVILDLTTSTYLSVNGSGTVLWPMLEKGATHPELVQALINEYEIDDALAQADVEEFVAELVRRELLAS